MWHDNNNLLHPLAISTASTILHFTCHAFPAQEQISRCVFWADPFCKYTPTTKCLLIAAIPWHLHASSTQVCILDRFTQIYKWVTSYIQRCEQNGFFYITCPFSSATGQVGVCLTPINRKLYGHWLPTCRDGYEYYTRTRPTMQSPHVVSTFLLITCYRCDEGQVRCVLDQLSSTLWADRPPRLFVTSEC